MTITTLLYGRRVRWHEIAQLLATSVMFLGTVFAPGCNGASSDIAKTAQKTSAQATQIKAETPTIRSANQAMREDSSPANIASQTAQSDASADNIDTLADGVKEGSQKTAVLATKVKDITPWWATLLGQLAILGTLALIVFVLLRLHLLDFVGRFIGAITPSLVEQASLDLDAVQEVRSNPSVEHAPAEKAMERRRGRSAVYEGAVRAAEKRKKLAK